MSKGVQIAIAAFTVFAAVVWVASTQSAGQGTFRYYSSVGDYLAHEPAAEPTLRTGLRSMSLLALSLLGPPDVKK